MLNYSYIKHLSDLFKRNVRSILAILNHTLIEHKAIINILILKLNFFNFFLRLSQWFLFFLFFSCSSFTLFFLILFLLYVEHFLIFFFLLILKCFFLFIFWLTFFLMFIIGFCLFPILFSAHFLWSFFCNCFVYIIS